MQLYAPSYFDDQAGYRREMFRTIFNGEVPV